MWEADENLALVTKERIALESLLVSMKRLACKLEVFQGSAGIQDARILRLKRRVLAHIFTHLTHRVTGARAILSIHA